MEAQTGNNMIPSNPGIVQQQARDGAQQVAPMHQGYQQPPQQPQQQAAPQVESYDFWSGLEQSIEPTEEYDLPQQQPQQYQVPNQPQQQQYQVPNQPASPGQQPQAQPQPDAQQPGGPSQLTFEQQAAILEAQGGRQAPQVQQAPQQTQQQPAQQPAQNYAAFEAQTIAHLASTEYAIPEDQARQMVAEPEKVYPQLAARMHVRLASQIGQAVQNMLPSVIDQMVEAKIRANNLEQEFFRTYKQLADPRFRPVVAASLRMAREINPQASPQQVMADGATLAAMKLRLNMNGQAPAQGQPVVQQQPQQFRQQQPAQQYAPPQAQPFMPAQGGGGAVLPTHQQEQNEFAALAMDPNW